ncbi:MAG: RlmE family RNA methyltransferase [Archangium sp.]|nr:RlmE family RNA methyltransferase [Archangium sp.]MDP3155338.1 RlmE family RNA methyltransferase [Archangium sp.]MDP3574792.1 RlmE family RNA methyltransferase [Archangium sp.]
MAKYQPKDFFFRKAKDEGLRARSAFKIDEIAKRFDIFEKGQSVVDLGAAPGGFLQIILNEIGPTGFVVGVDLAAIKPLGKPNVKTAVMDVLADDFAVKLEALHPGPVDVVVSDLAPKTTGVKDVDLARSHRLAGIALDISRARGKPGSHFIAKLFMGGDFEAFRADVKRVFSDVKVVRPDATRQASMEIYLVGLSKK